MVEEHASSDDALAQILSCVAVEVYMNGSASTIPRAMLDGDGAEARRVLLDGGLYLGPGRKSRELLNILPAWHPVLRAG